MVRNDKAHVLRRRQVQMNVLLSVCRVEWLGVVGFGLGCGCYVGCEKAEMIAGRVTVGRGLGGYEWM